MGARNGTIGGPAFFRPGDGSPSATKVVLVLLVGMLV